MNTGIIWQLLLQIILIALNAVFACAEIAVLSINDAKLAQLMEQGDKKAVKLDRLISKPAKFLATIQVAITLSGFFGSAFAADNFASLLTNILIKTKIPFSAEVFNSISVIIITLILSYLTLVFGELVPKRIAMKKAEKLGLAMASFITVISKIFAPLVWLLTASTNGVLRLFKIDPDDDDETVSEDDIKMLVDEGTKSGIIDSEEKEIIHNLFEFDDTTVAEFATHRTELSVLWLDDDISQWKKTINETRFDYYPVCRDTTDEIECILSADDYFRLLDKSKDSILKNATEDPYFIPKNIFADVLFKNMKKYGKTFAVVLDEYGGVYGVVTMNDLLSQIVGEFNQPAGDEKDTILPQDKKE